MDGLSIYGAKIVQTEEWFCTVFPNDPDEMPQDFYTYKEAEEYGDSKFGKGAYTIESPC